MKVSATTDSTVVSWSNLLVSTPPSWQTAQYEMWVCVCVCASGACGVNRNKTGPLLPLDFQSKSSTFAFIPHSDLIFVFYVVIAHIF